MTEKEDKNISNKSVANISIKTQINYHLLEVET